MMQNLWRVQTEKKIHTPHDIISEQCKYLSEMTDGKVIARIAPYKGDYKSYSKSNELELAGRLLCRIIALMCKMFWETNRANLFMNFI